MASVVAIVGSSGAGKSTGGKHLNPDTTIWINCDKKDLPFKGWKSMYSGENKNYLRDSSPRIVRTILEKLKDRPAVKTVVVDTMNAIMLDDEMKRMREKGYDKWTDLSVAVYDIIGMANDMTNDDLVIFLIFHEESFLDDDGIRTTRILTNGKKLNKIQLETKITTVLWAKKAGEDGKNEHWFETKSNNNTAKSPEGMFADFKIPNDLELVRKTVVEYNK